MKKGLTYIVIGIIAIVAIIVIYQMTKCKEGEPCGEKNGELDTLTCFLDTIPDSLKTINQKDKINNINFYFENSGSMRGYLNSTNFRDVVSNLIVKLNGRENKDSLKLYTIASDVLMFEEEPSIFIEELANGIVPLNGFSTMHNIFRQILNNSKSNDINFFVSDCILSYSNEDIQHNREINRESAAALKNQLLNIVQCQDDISFALFAFKSDFDGTYYDYHNTRIINSFNNRPYYIWVAGKKKLLIELISWINSEKLPTFNRHLKEKILFNCDNIVANDHRIFRKPGGKSYQPSPDKKSIVDIVIDSITFFVQLNLDCLPNRIKDKDYLKTNLIVEATQNKQKTKVAISTIYDDQNEFETKVATHTTKIYIDEKATHFIQIDMAQISSTEVLHITLPCITPNWYKQWSTMDDTNIDENFDKTFAFEWFVDGIKEAYTNNNYIDISININKKIK